MALHAGARIGPYEILALLGIGGMGEVYRARDTKLNRDVALKVLPDSFANDPDRLARFERETQVLASLNHPNIAHIHGVEDSGRVRAFVMELVEGEDLAERLKRGPIRIDEALPLAVQIADALEAAHEQGVVHRDLKPANIKIRDDGTVKVLDFGLAKALDPVASSADLSRSPTITSPAVTQAGVILGTAAYMSPEQAKGRPADRRSDIWAFGCVLYEMLTGRGAFGGEDVSETLAAILRGAPDWNRLPPATPFQVHKLLRGCLQKERRERVPDIAVARFEIKDALANPNASGAFVGVVQPTVSRPLWRRAAPLVATALLTSAIAGAAVWSLIRPPSPSRPITRFTITHKEGRISPNFQPLALSPDGTQLVYVSGGKLYVRAFADLEAKVVPGPENRGNPVFSPDGRSIAFMSTSDGILETVDVGSGSVLAIAPIRNLLGMSWGSSGILFGQPDSIMRVPAKGGTPETIVRAAENERLFGPQVLPGGEWVLFTKATIAQLSRGTVADWDKAQIVVQSLKSSYRIVIISGGSDGRYMATGHLIYANSGRLLAIPFDSTRMTVGGPPVAVVEGVMRGPAAAHFSVSDSGSLVFVPGPISAMNESTLALIERSGTPQRLNLPEGAYEYPRVSPDGQRIAVGTSDSLSANIWIYDMSGTASIRQLTLQGRNRVPVWSPDGEHVAFQSDREGDLAVFWQRADGATPAERLTKPEKETAHAPQSWSRDGKTLLITVIEGPRYSLSALDLSNHKLTPVPGVESSQLVTATFSPDGAWIAYAAVQRAASGIGRKSSVFVRPFPSTGAVYALGEGAHPSWSPDGKELFHLMPGDRLVVRNVTTKPSFTFGNPTSEPSGFRARGPGAERNYDVMPDGKRFVAVVTSEQAFVPDTSAGARIHVVLNWLEELKQRVPMR